jgi:hypothetical protein
VKDAAIQKNNGENVMTQRPRAGADVAAHRGGLRNLQRAGELMLRRLKTICRRSTPMRTASGDLIVALTGLLSLSACDDMNAVGFTLPRGDEAAGERTFVEMACNDCHSVVGRDELRADATPYMDVALGGPTERIRTYGQLVTAIINPSHRIAEGYQGEPFVVDGVSQMQNYNDALTVTQLINLVTFLEAQYELVPLSGTEYVPYEYP